MGTPEIQERLRRIYAAIDFALEPDLSKLPPRVISTKQVKGVFQDFSGGQSKEDLSNLAYTIIHNIANLQNYLQRWAVHNGHDKAQVDDTVNKSAELKIIKDLSNNDKHGYPPRGNGHSGKAPRLQYIIRVLMLTTPPKKGEGVTVGIDLSGNTKVTGSGSATAVVTGDVVDKSGEPIGDLYKISMKAVEAWENLIRNFGIIL